MKKIINNLKGKKVLSFVLAAIMLVTTFSVAMPMLKLDANAADITLSEGNVSITQTRVVSDYATKYAEYANRFFGGNGKSEPTNFVIPGLSSSDDYTPQGMTYWKAKDWILISAYDATGQGKNSVIYALDGKTTKFVALFKIQNSDGSVNTSHGGGIAASEYNFYYADTGSKISYIPLSDMDVAPGTVKTISLKGSIDCAGELGGAATSYCCYDNGVLWTGNFYFTEDDRYNKPAYDAYPSVLMGYKLVGNSSEEEWAHLNGKYKNLLEVDTSSGTGSTNGANLSWKAYKSGDFVDVVGSISAPTATVDEFTPTFGSFSLTEGKQYIIQYTTNVHPSQCDFYMFAPNGGGHMNVNLAKDLVITQLDDGRWHVSLKFTAGLRSTGTDSSWQTTQSTNGTYTGKYTIRFDQDDIQVGEARQFAFTDVSITEASDHLLDLNNETRLGYRGNHAGVVGNPTYCVLFSKNLDRVQYAMVDNGRIYISRSWSRSESTYHIRELVVGEIDLNAQGTIDLTINGKSRKCLYVDEAKMTKFGGDKNNLNRSSMFYMGEALCVIEGYLYMFAESAGWTYYGKEDNKCSEPIDVIWKIDQFAIMDELRETDNEKSLYYEKVTDVEQIANTDNSLQNTDEYIIVYESEEKDPVTQKNILYALDAFGGHNGNKLPKNNSTMTDNPNGYTVGIVGHPITQYAVEGNKLYLSNPKKDDVENLRWKFSGSQNGQFALHSAALYYSKYKSLHLNGIEAFMSKEDFSRFYVEIHPEFNYEAYIRADGYYLWGNDGTQNYDNSINKYYQDKGYTYTEQPGTFHADGANELAAINKRNVLNNSVADFSHRRFFIYKRVLDPNTEKENSRVYTNSTAELQSDGTYTINMETYAISPTHYTLLERQRPTDFIFVLDTSGSMSSEDCNGYHRHDAFDLEAAAGNDDVAGCTNSSSNSGTTATYTGNMWVQHTDGVMCPVTVKVQGDGRSGSFLSYTYYQKVYLWYTHPVTGKKYWFHPNSDNTEGTWTTSETTYDQAMRIGGTSQSERLGRVVFSGVCYEKRSNSSRLSNMQIALNQLTYKIQNEAQTTGFDHRIAIVQYGSDSSGSWTNTGMYTNAGTSRVAYTGAGTVSDENYRKAFFTVDQFGNVRTIIDKLTASGDTFVDCGFDMAQNIIKHAKDVDGNTGYLADGNRSACVIMLTDGCPGYGGNDSSTANRVAEAAIDNAKLAKEAGAYIFTVQLGNNSMSGFDMGKYLDYTSSEYVDATGMETPGERNPNDVNYRLDVSAVGSFNLDSFVDSMFTNVTANSRMALTQLNTESILRQTLSDEFYAPVGENGAKVQYLLADAYYDGLGRITFGAETDAASQGVVGTSTPATDSAGNQYYKSLEVRGFDYKNDYISKEHGGKKLIIRITGVLPRTTSVKDGSDITHTNSHISDDSNTGIYQNDPALRASKEFKSFPNESFTIPEYTYVLDYDIPMLDTDVNGTLKSVDGNLVRQSTYKVSRESDNIALNFVDGNQNMTYELKSGLYNEEEKQDNASYCLIQRDDGTYDWFKINIVPASNVLFEEKRFTATSKANTAKWSTDGAPLNNSQSLSGENDRYGYDEAYANNGAGHSNGTAYKATVNSTTKRSETMNFNYTGTGFDLMSACGKNTGILMVSVKNSAGKLEKLLLVDTYYNDGNDDTNTLLKQVPVVSYTNAAGHGTYSVDVAGAYLSSAQGVTGGRAVSTNPLLGGLLNSFSSKAEGYTVESLLEEFDIDIPADEVELIWFDDNSVLNGGTGPASAGSKARSTTATAADIRLDCYVDSIRVYNPLGSDSSDYIASEKGAQYYNVIGELKTATADNQLSPDDNGLFAYVTGDLEPDDEGNTPALSFANYQSVGPQHELYLAQATNQSGSHAVSFNVRVAGGDSRVMISLRAVNGSTTAKISSGSKEASQFAINTATEQYYDITPYLDFNTSTGIANVVITNVGGGLLSVNNLKIVDAAVMPVSGEDLPVMVMSLRANPVTVEPNSYDYNPPAYKEDVQEPETDAPAEDDTPEADEPVTDVPMDLTSIIKMLLKFIETIILKFF